MKSLIALAGFAIALLPQATQAQSCSGGSASSSSSSSSSGSSSSSSWDSGSSSSGSASSERVSRCAHDTPVVGESECRRFGRTWDVSRRRAWQIGLDLGATQLRLDDIAVTGTSMHDNRPHAWRATDIDAGLAFRFAMRLSVLVLPHLYVGLEGGIAGRDIEAQGESTTSDITMSSVLGVDGSLLVGGGLGIGRHRLNLEASAGRRRVMLSGQSQVGECIVDIDKHVDRWMLRAGVGVQLFLTPWVSMNLRGAYDVLYQEVSASLGFALHTRSFDAR